MKTPHHRGVETRRLYQFEHAYLKAEDFPFLTRPRDRRTLQRMACEVWTARGRLRTRVPDVVLRYDITTSWCIGRGEIHLASDPKLTRNNIPHNTYEVLLHELTHALGYGRPHGTGFNRAYIELLVDWGRCNEGELRMAMSHFKVKH